MEKTKELLFKLDCKIYLAKTLIEILRTSLKQRKTLTEGEVLHVRGELEKIEKNLEALLQDLENLM
ncbi:hypothetical protein [Caldisericum sp.]|uniref:hypothetical protein n=1 Tax=Caldisericum sp. TaxID=2499687 RepID=UPI003D0EBC08